MKNIEELSVNAIRVLSADAIQKAKSGHPGLPLGAASMAYELWAHHMKHNPKDPLWADRDRFILSGGHGSMLLYSLFHLFGYGDLSLEELKNFRHLGALTPGHPEYGHTVGVEATTGPLGTGMGTAVGMAMAEAHLAAEFNKEGYPVVDHYTYVLGGDGCVMEGVSSEAFSLAGTLGLHKLIVLYDSNNITIEGSTDLAFTEDVAKRMEAFGFQTLDVKDGNDLSAIGRAIEEAKADTKRPSFITIHTEIGYGCPAKQGKSSAHGEPLGEDNVAQMKAFLAWPSEEPFYVPEEVYENYRSITEGLAAPENAWKEMFEEYALKFPEMKEKWDNWHTRENLGEILEKGGIFDVSGKTDATRNHSFSTLNKVKDILPQLMGGSADLGPSNKSSMKDTPDFSKENYAGRNIHFGIREFAMGLTVNGMLLHGGVIPYAATFMVFSDFMKPAMRLASLQKIPAIYILTHESLGDGEDGPTHQAIEHAAMLRAMPNFHLFRPADAMETNCAWYSALTSLNTPTGLALTRQSVPEIEGTSKEALRGGYILSDSEKETPDAIIIASGSELQYAAEAKKTLLSEGIDVRVVSMPCMDIFEEQDEAYKEKVLPKTVLRRVAVEAMSGFGWERYTGFSGKILSMDRFGASAPASDLFPYFGFTAENVVATVKELF